MITILTTTFNCGATLHDTLKSVQELSTYIPVEHLLLDAGSNDNTWELIAAHTAQYSWAHALSRPGSSITTALNELIALASHPFILILHGDDYLLPENIVSVLPNIKSEEIIYCGSVSVLSGSGQYIGNRVCAIKEISKYMSINHPAMIVPKKIYDQIGVFNSSYPTSFDYEWVWRTYRQKITYVALDEVLAAARLGGISSKRARQAAHEIASFKARDGKLLLAIQVLASFYLKLAVRRLMPSTLEKRLVAWFRGMRTSIDNY